MGEQTLSAQKFESGPILVDNEDDEKFTVVTIGEGKERVTALLDVASAMTGIGVIIHEAIIQVRLPSTFSLPGRWVYSTANVKISDG